MGLKRPVSCSLFFVCPAQIQHAHANAVEEASRLADLLQGLGVFGREPTSGEDVLGMLLQQALGLA